MTQAGDSPYAVLEVPRSADAATIEAAYHRLTGLLSDGALASYGMLDAADVGPLRHQLDQAYAVLSSPQRRRHFDVTGEVDVVPQRPVASSPSIASTACDATGAFARPLQAAPRGVTPAAPPAGLARAAPVALPPHVAAAAASPTASPTHAASATSAPPAPGAAGATSATSPLPEARFASDVAAATPAHPAEHQLSAFVAQSAPTHSGASVLPAASDLAVTPHRPAVVGRPSLLVPLLAEVAADATYDGTLLRRLRQSAQVSVEELSEWTKIGRRYLQAIEDQDFALLPARVYVRGFVGEVARVLGLPARQACQSYLAGYDAWLADR